MKPVFSPAKTRNAKRVIYADGEDERVLRAAQVVLEEGIAAADPDRPPARHRGAAEALRPADQAGHATSTLINPEDDPRYRDYVDDL